MVEEQIQILPYEHEPNLDEAGLDEESTPDTPDGRFPLNFELTKKLLISPQSIRDSLSQTDVAAAFLALVEIWLKSELSPMDKGLRNFAAFVCPKPPYVFDKYSEEILEYIYVQIRLQWGIVVNWLANSDLQQFNEEILILTGLPPEHPDPSVAMNIIAHMAFNVRHILFYEQQLEALTSGKLMSEQSDSINFGKFSSRNNNNLTRHQRCQLILLRKFEQLKLRKCEREIYVQRTTEPTDLGDDSQRYYTHSWKHMDSIDNFVAGVVSKEEDFETWKDLTSGPSFKPICDKLALMKDADFPDLVKDRHYFSYRDGIYHVTYDDFYSYRHQTSSEVRNKVFELQQKRDELRRHRSVPTGYRDFTKISHLEAEIAQLHAETRLRGSDLLPTSLATANYTDLNFIPPEFEDFKQYSEECVRWDSIYTPNFDRILDHQDFYEKTGEPVVCSKFCCGQRARYALHADTRPRWCEDHRLADMVDKVRIPCANPGCTDEATLWISQEEAKKNGTERIKFCFQHATVGSEDIPEPIRNSGGNNVDIAVDGDNRHSVKNIFYALVGRLHYNVGEFDNWQVIAFLKGLANTGKSTVIKIIQSFYDPQDVQVLSNNVERRFGLEPIMSKFLYVAPEVKDNFGLDQAEFQSMVSGDPMSISRKFKLAITRTWAVPGILAGNTPPKWADKSGSIARRVVTFPFDCPVRITDSTLEEESKKETPYIQRKANLAYHSLVKYLQTQENKSIWSLMPQKLQRAKQDLHMSCSQLGHFVKENDEIVVASGPDRMTKFVPWEFFLTKLHEFNIQKRQHIAGHLEAKEFIEFFATLKVEVVFDESPSGQPNQRPWYYDQHIYKSPFLYGMDYKPPTAI